MQVDTLMKSPARSALWPLDRYLLAENDVLRSAAVRALPVLAMDGAEAVRDALRGALLDPDPDIRSDAMGLLGPMAQAEDAELIRKSLQGDPVREVKLAAIAALARLGDHDSIPLLRALVRSRAEDEVAWEDAGSDWEEWLDVQTAAITALGTLQAEEAIDDLIEVLFDAFGQSVDVPVCQALSDIGEIGVATLLEVFNQAKGVARRRAGAALSQADPDSLRLQLDALLAAEEPQLRHLALRVLAPEDARSALLTRSDPDPGVRAAALRHAAPAVAELARDGLSDASETVKAAALACLSGPFDPEFEKALVDNMLTWLDRASPPLAIAVIERLPQWASDRARDACLKVIDDADRDLEIRVAAAKALGRPDLQTPVDVIAAHLDNPAHQVRMTLLTVLRERAAVDHHAVEIAASVIAGEIAVPEQPWQRQAVDHEQPDAGTPKEGSGPAKIWITPEGDIIARDAADAQEGLSTLDAILADAEVSQPPKLAGETPEESAPKRAKRRAVEGSDDIAISLACDAMRVFEGHESSVLTSALIARLDDGDATLRRTAWQVLASCRPDADLQCRAQAGFRDKDPTIRLAAYRILSKLAPDVLLADALADDDALIRAEAIAGLPAEAALAFIGDPAPVVRDRAVRRILEAGEGKSIEAAVEHAIRAERQDTLRKLVAGTRIAQEAALAALSAADVTDRRALIVLTGLAAS